MKQYYAERNGLIDDSFSLSFSDLKNYFGQTYDYFLKKGCFQAAFGRITLENNSQGVIRRIVDPSMKPSPEAYFAVRFHNKNIWPIEDRYEKYDEGTLFTVIEVLYDHIAVFNPMTGELDKHEVQDEFAQRINALLKLYKKGYYLVSSSGFIMEQPNQALKEQLRYKGYWTTVNKKDTIFDGLGKGISSYAC